MARSIFKYNQGPLLRAQVDDVLPEHIRANYPRYVEFLKHCTDFLENENRAGFILNRVHTQRDIDLVDTQFLRELQAEIGNAIPQSYAANPRLFYKRLGEIYRSRGTPDSIVAFFKLLYNDNVEIYFPSTDIFAPSDGRWFDAYNDVQINFANYTPRHTFTITGTPTIIGGNTLDDGGFYMEYNKPTVVVNGVKVDNWRPYTTVDNTLERLVYWIEFDSPLADADIVQIYSGGSFSTNDSFTNDLKKLQDSFFYQKFSYVLKTGTDIELWKNAFTRLVHPAGFIFFGEILVLIELLTGTPTSQPGYQFGGEPVTITIAVINGKPSLINVVENIPTVNGPYTETYPIWQLEFGAQGQDNGVAPNIYFNFLKYKFNATTIGQLSKYSIEDAINNRIPFNMDAEITISN